MVKQHHILKEKKTYGSKLEQNCVTIKRTLIAAKT